MELEHHFEVPVGIDQAWSHLLNMDEVAACFPGATLTSADGQEYTGSVKVKLGPIQLTYRGSARIVEADEPAHRATIEASGKAARSGSTASMTVVATATEVAADRTEVTMTTDLTITGKPAQFGRGVMADVGDKILGKFANCIAGKLAAGEDDGGNDAAPGDAAPNDAPPEQRTSATPDGGADTTDDADTAAAASAPSDHGRADDRATASYSRVPDPDGASEPIDLLDSAGLPVMKRFAPVAGGALVLLLIVWMLRRRR